MQTAEQVRAVRNFIEANFRIEESDDKGLLLSRGRVRLPRHALHSSAFAGARSRGRLHGGRTAGDRRQARGDPGANLAAACLGGYAARPDVQEQAEALERGDPDGGAAGGTDGRRRPQLQRPRRRPGRVDRQLYGVRDTRRGGEGDSRPAADSGKRTERPEEGRAVVGSWVACWRQSGAYGGVVEALSPYAETCVAAERSELLLELGDALCRLHRDRPRAAEFGLGRRHLEKAVALCAGENLDFVPHLRNRESQRARSVAAPGRRDRGSGMEDHAARECFREAHEHEPFNPYYLAGMLGFELRFGQQGSLPDSMRTTIREGVRACLSHAAAGIELTFAYFTGGRLSLLLADGGNQALAHYARGIRYFLEGAHCVPAGILEEEAAWIRGAWSGLKPPPAAQRALDLLALGTKGGDGGRSGAGVGRAGPDCGGRSGRDGARNWRRRYRPVLRNACERFQGTVTQEKP